MTLLSSPDGTDFIAEPQNITFAPNARVACTSLPLVDDTTIEQPEAFRVHTSLSHFHLKRILFHTSSPCISPYTCHYPHIFSLPLHPQCFPLSHRFSLSHTISPSLTLFLSLTPFPPLSHCFPLPHTISPSLTPFPPLSHRFPLSHTISPSLTPFPPPSHRFSLSHTASPSLTPFPPLSHRFPLSHTVSTHHR